MSLTQQQGTADQVAPLQVPSLAPWRYLWLSANAVAGAGGGGASAWWTGSPGGGHAADLVLTAGQSQMVDTGAVSSRTLWVAGDLEWITDSDPISEQVTQSTQVTLAPGSTVSIVSGTVGISGPVTLAAGQQVVVSAGSVNIAGGQGGAVNVGTTQPPQLLGSFTVNVNSYQNFTLPVGTQAVKISFWGNAASSGNVRNVQVSGLTTNSQYLNVNFPTQNELVVGVDQATDAQIQVGIYGTVSVTASVTALLGSADVTVGNSPSDPLYTDSSSRGSIQYATLLQSFTPYVGVNLFDTGGVPTSLWGWTIVAQPPAVTGQFGLELFDASGAPIDAAIGYVYSAPVGVIMPVVVSQSLAVPIRPADGVVFADNKWANATTGMVSVRYSVP